MKRLLVLVLLVLTALALHADRRSIITAVSRPSGGGGGGGGGGTLDYTNGVVIWLKADFLTGLSDGDPVGTWKHQQ
jgi:hypothetical protein